MQKWTDGRNVKENNKAKHMTVNILDRKDNTLLNRFLAELRDVGIQKDSMRFRRNLERVAEIMAYEISRTLDYSPVMVETPLGETEAMLYSDRIVLATILRAGLPFHHGFLNYFDNAHNAFVSAYRKHHKDGSFDVKVEYISCGDLEGKTLILADPMLATGSSFVMAYRALLEKGGKPAHVHIASAIGSEEGVEYVRNSLPSSNTTIWCASVDQELTVQSYIVPGLGDAGDLAYGEKLE